MATSNVSRKRMISPSIENDSTSDEDAFLDNSNDIVDYDDSDEEYRPMTKKQMNVGKRCTSGTSNAAPSSTIADGKRLKTFYRNHSISSSNTDGGNGKCIQRKPTRRPNPKIFNRNALMARENRRKKKEHLETLERDIEMFRMENASLKKSLKSKTTFVTKLKQEQLYLKSVIANKTEIMALLKTIKGNKIPMTSSVLSFMTESESVECNDTVNQEQAEDTCNNNKNDETVSCYGSGTPTSSTSTLSCGEDDIDNDFRQPSYNGSGNGEGDDDDDDFNNTYDNWQNILNDDTPFNTVNVEPLAAPNDAAESADELLSTVNNEHNYFNNNTIASSHKGDTLTTSSTTAPGICLHLSGGRVSLEFCSTCHLSSQNAWFEEI